jgi:RHS repeat-associated protein
MKTIKAFLLAVSVLTLAFVAQAQNSSLDECAYPPGMAADYKFMFARLQTTNSIVITSGTNVNYSHFAPDYYLSYSCGYYYDDDLIYGMAYILNKYMTNQLQLVEPGTNDTGYIKVTESHSGTSFDASTVYQMNEINTDTEIGTTTVSGELLDGYVTSYNMNSGKDGVPCICQACHNMPRWFITEPYLDLWVKDTPVFYTTSLGQEIDFTMAYKQHDTRPLNTTVPPTGWSHNWFSYVHFVVPTYLSGTNSTGPGFPMPGPTGPAANIIKTGWVFTNDFSQWQAILYATDNSEHYFNLGVSEAKSGLTLLPADGGSSASGFKLIHPDGSVDEYTLVSSPTFSFGIEENKGLIYDTGANAPKLFTFGQQQFYAGACNSDGTPIYTEDTSDETTSTGTVIGDQVGYVACDALLTRRIDPYGNSIFLTYSNSGTQYFLQSIVDYDGKTTTLGYNGQGMLTGVSMPYGRSASFTYGKGQITGSTDAQGMSSSFTYDIFPHVDLNPYSGQPILETNIYLTSLTTPYGTTSFSHFEASPVMAITNPPSKQWKIASDGSASITVDYGGSTTPAYVGWYGRTAKNGVNKACTVTYPDGSHELYMYRYDSTNLVPSTYPAAEIPPLGVSVIDDGIDHDAADVDDPDLIDHLLSTRNTFHWNRQQYALLSTTDIQNLSSNDFAVATMKHWLETDTTETFYPKAPEFNVSGEASLVREASPDGVREGAKTWIHYDNQSGWHVTGDDISSTAGTLLPDGSVRTITTGYGGGLSGVTTDTYTTPDGTQNTRTSGYSYDTVYVNDASGNFLYDYQRLQSILDPLGARNFSYADDGSKMNVTDDGGTATYFYNSRHQVTGIKHANGLTTTNIYGNDGFLAESIDIEAGATTLYSFANGLPSSITSSLGLQLTYSWDNLSRLTGVAFPDGTTVSNTYNRLDLVAKKDRLNHWTHTVYNSLDQPNSFTDANGNTTSYSYCSCGALASITDPLGNSTVFTRDYDGNATQAASSDGFSTYYHRNILGQVTNLTTTAGLNLNYSYSGWGLVTRVTGPAGTVFAAAYDADDRPVAITNAQGVAIANSYDSVGRLTERDNALGRTERNSYGPQGITEHDEAQWWQSTTFTYDPAGRLAGTTDANGNTDGFTYNPAGQIATLTDGNGNVTSWAYDAYGRSIAKTNGNNVLVETNGYDANGRLTAHWTPAKGLTYYTYDANGNPLAASYSSGTGITAAYDALNRITSMIDAVGSSTFTWQNFGAFQGALASENGPWANDTVTHGYANRLPISLTLAQPGGLWSELYGYDGSLRLATVYSPAGTFGYTYNGAGRQIQSLSLPGSGNSIAGAYDAAGRLLTTALTHGTTVLDSQAYVYVNGNRTSVTRTDGSHVNYGYDYASQLTSATGYEPNGTTLRRNENFSYQYDPAGNLAARQNDTLSEIFTTDAANELVNVAQNNNQMTVAGVLNGHPSGLTVNGQAAAVYNDLTFAAAGVAINDGLNTFTAVVTTASSPMTNSMTEMLPASANLTYDLNGNLTSDGRKGYAYDCVNELASETVTNGWRNEFVYDGFGRRRVRREYSWSGSVWTETNEVRYVYDGMNVIQERDGNNNPLATYTRGMDLSGDFEGAGGIGGLLARTDANGSAYYHADGNGNITAMMDASGNQVAKYLYDPYGNMVGMWGTLAQANTYRFSSKEIDVKSGLYYYGYRYYEPNLQRFLNNDPIKEQGGINLYTYVRNNPINEFDLWGLDAVFRFIGGGTQTAANAEQFQSIANNAANGSIISITITGHTDAPDSKGGADLQGLGRGDDQGEIYQGSKGTVLTDPNWNPDQWPSLSDLLEDKMAPDGSIILKGCKSGVPSDPNNIAKAISQDLPGVSVTGQNENLNYIPFTDFTVPFYFEGNILYIDLMPRFNTTTTYLNGEIK